MNRGPGSRAVPRCLELGKVTAVAPGAEGSPLCAVPHRAERGELPPRLELGSDPPKPVRCHAQARIAQLGAYENHSQ
jgi:hypothetical protein